MGNRLKNVGKFLAPFVAGPYAGLYVNIARKRKHGQEHRADLSDRMHRAQRKAADEAAQPDPAVEAAIDRERQRRRLLRGRESTSVTPLGAASSASSNPLKLIGS